MAIIATRIDGRLIHGQVANLWTGKLNISRIMTMIRLMFSFPVHKFATCP